MSRVQRTLLLSGVLVALVAALSRAHSILELPEQAHAEPRAWNLTIEGIRPGLSRRQIESRFGQGRPLGAQDFVYGDVYVRYRDDQASFVAGRQLERRGQIVIASNGSIEDADRALEAPHQRGFRKGANGPQPAVRYDRCGVTLLLVPDTATISSVALCNRDTLSPTPEPETARR
jgi:hypothetical protein